MLSLASGKYFRATDAILDIIINKTSEGAAIALPVFTCTSSIVNKLKACNRKIVWMDIDEYSIQITLKEVMRVIYEVDAVILQSYWGQSIRNLDEISKLTRDNNKILIIDYAHRLEIDEILNHKETDASKGNCFRVYSFSKELPYFLGGICIPAVVQVKVSYSLELALHAIGAGISMWASRRKHELIEKMIREKILKKGKQQNSSNQQKMARPMSIVQTLFLKWHIDNIKKNRILRAELLKRINVNISDKHIWAGVHDISDENGSLKKLKQVQMWPEFQKYEPEQFTDSLCSLIKNRKLYLYEL